MRKIAECDDDGTLIRQIPFSSYPPAYQARDGSEDEGRAQISAGSDFHGDGCARATIT